VKQRKDLLGKIDNDEVQLGLFGEITAKRWKQVSQHFSHVECDDFVIMPNHFHGIIVIQDCQPSSDFFTPTLGNIVAYLKYQSTKEINTIRKTPGVPFWQRNYYDHIIRNKDDYRMIYDYTQSNPLRWKDDKFFTKP
jgi:putative transposase